ncbi:MAG: O-methyltransferase [Deltaproteobacteria bacterium]|nr:O-methyltransferase [Deltaproteobacteria bacterium]
MSEISTHVDQRHFDYLAARTTRDDDFLVALKAAAREAGLPAIWISPEQASFMQILLRSARAREVVEVGTLAGYSAITMARALPPDGRLRTLELMPAHAAFAREWVSRSDVADRIEVLEGGGAELLPTFASGTVDAIFLDADKAGYAGYLEEARRLLKPGGLLLCDNAFAFGDLFSEGEVSEGVAAIRAFNDLLAADPDFHGVIVPIGDGLWVGVREGEEAPR